MDPEADAYASCPRYETTDSPSGCRCPCPGCQHHCTAHQEAPAEGRALDPAEAYADAYLDRLPAGQAEMDAVTEAPTVEGCGICTQFTPCPNPGVGCFVNPPAACTACDDSDEAFCAVHEYEAQRRVHTAVADGVAYFAFAPNHLTPSPCRNLANPDACPGCAVHDVRPG